jgi:hypothetical protein
MPYDTSTSAPTHSFTKTLVRTWFCLSNRADFAANCTGNFLDIPLELRETVNEFSRLAILATYAPPDISFQKTFQERHSLRIADFHQYVRDPVVLALSTLQFCEHRIHGVCSSLTKRLVGVASFGVPETAVILT